MLITEQKRRSSNDCASELTHHFDEMYILRQGVLKTGHFEVLIAAALQNEQIRITLEGLIDQRECRRAGVLRFPARRRKLPGWRCWQRGRTILSPAG